MAQPITPPHRGSAALDARMKLAKRRDDIAVEAMKAFLTHGSIGTNVSDPMDQIKLVAQASYAMADAMLEARDG